MIDGFTYPEFATLMMRYEPDSTEADVDRAWVVWCCKDLNKPTTKGK